MEDHPYYKLLMLEADIRKRQFEAVLNYYASLPLPTNPDPNKTITLVPYRFEPRP